MKLLPILIFLCACTLNAQTQQTMAILDLSVESPVSVNQGRFVSDNLRARFNASGKYIVLDKWIVDTVLSEQGFNTSHPCATEQCLLAMAHLLTVNKVLGGTISVKGKFVEVFALMVDVDAGRVVASGTMTIPVIQKRVIDKNIDKLYQCLLVQPHAAEKAGLPSQTPQQTASNSVKVKNSKQGDHKKSLFQKSGFWVTTSAVIVSAPVIVLYLNCINNRKRNVSDNDIPLGNTPSHTP